MKKSFIWLILMVAGLTGGMMFPCQSVVQAVFAGDVVIICNKEVPDNSLTRKDIRDIYTGKKIQWNDQSKIVFVTLRKSETHDSFLNHYVGKSSFQFTSFWRKQLYTGKGTLPKAFENEKELVEYVAGAQGAIGYVSADTDTGGVKIISVE